VGPRARTTPVDATLSISMIVRDEALRLPAFLEAHAGLADEICITDTGSKDGTVEIASAAGCVVHAFTWCGDFAAARNAALRPCVGEWILSLDADERIEREDWPALRALMSPPKERAYRMVTQNYTDQMGATGFVWSPPDDPRRMGFPGWFPSTKTRLFPNVPGVSFEGQVHEMPHQSLARLGIALHDSPIPVYHYPLLEASVEARAAKQALYLELGIRKRDTNPNDPLAHHELGDQYLDLGRGAEAFQCYKEAVRLEPENPRWLADLGGVLLLMGQVPQAIQALTLALARDPAGEEVWRNLGVAHARRENWCEARDAFERALALNPVHPENRRYLAIALEGCGERARAIALLEGLLGEFPAHEEARALLERLRLNDEW